MRLMLNNCCRADYDSRTSWHVDKLAHGLSVPKEPIHTITLGTSYATALDTSRIDDVRLEVELERDVALGSQLSVYALGKNALRQVAQTVALTFY
jgi:hypothetical protein